MKRTSTQPLIRLVTLGVSIVISFLFILAVGKFTYDAQIIRLYQSVFVAVLFLPLILYICFRIWSKKEQWLWIIGGVCGGIIVVYLFSFLLLLSLDRTIAPYRSISFIREQETMSSDGGYVTYKGMFHVTGIPKASDDLVYETSLLLLEGENKTLIQNQGKIPLFMSDDVVTIQEFIPQNLTRDKKIMSITPASEMELQIRIFAKGQFIREQHILIHPVWNYDSVVPKQVNNQISQPRYVVDTVRPTSIPRKGITIEMPTLAVSPTPFNTVYLEGQSVIVAKPWNEKTNTQEIQIKMEAGIQTFTVLTGTQKKTQMLWPGHSSVSLDSFKVNEYVKFKADKNNNLLFLEKVE